MENRLYPVRLPSQIRRNLQQLEDYRHSHGPAEREYWRERVRLGVDFIVYRANGALSFAPSRFVGYQNNSASAHSKYRYKDGGVTNAAICRVLGRDFTHHEGLETEYRRFCTQNGIEATRKDRKYLDIGVQVWSPGFSNTTVAEDIAQIRSDRGLTATEKETLVSARIGQGAFRRSLIEHWGACAVTKCKQYSLLRASHIRPWRDSDNSERLDPFNGILLVPNLDAALDEGLITFDETGAVQLSSKLSREDASLLGIRPGLRAALTPRHESYLQYHRAHIFRR